jgi:hypothetical protein
MNDDDDMAAEDEVTEEWIGRLKDEYNAPGPTPRDEMWSAIESRLAPRGAETLSLDEARARRRADRGRLFGWAVATAALFVVGIGIGRSTAPSARAPGSVAEPIVGVEGSPPNAAPLRFAALRHLERTEGLLTLVRADGRSGRLDPSAGPWATSLLAQTRLLLDYTDTTDPAMRGLLEDLELVLVQIVGASDLDGADDARASAEVTITLDAIEQHEVVPRIQALMPTGAGLAGV